MGFEICPTNDLVDDDCVAPLGTPSSVAGSTAALVASGELPVVGRRHAMVRVSAPNAAVFERVVALFDIVDPRATGVAVFRRAASAFVLLALRPAAIFRVLLGVSATACAVSRRLEVTAGARFKFTTSVHGVACVVRRVTTISVATFANLLGSLAAVATPGLRRAEGAGACSLASLAALLVSHVTACPCANRLDRVVVADRGILVALRVARATVVPVALTGTRFAAMLFTPRLFCFLAVVASCVPAGDVCEVRSAGASAERP